MKLSTLKIGPRLAVAFALVLALLLVFVAIGMALLSDMVALQVCIASDRRCALE